MAENDIGLTMTLDLPSGEVVATPVTALVRGRVSHARVRGGVGTTTRATARVRRLRGAVESVVYGENSEEVRGGAR